MKDNLVGLLFLIPFAAAIVTPMVGLRYRALCRPLAVSAVSAMTVISLWAYVEVLASGPIHYEFSGWPAPYGIEWVLDGLSGLLMVTFSAIGVVVLVFAGPVQLQHLGAKVVPYYTLISMFFAAMTGITLCADLFNLFVFLEVGALCSYGLIAVAGGRALMSAFRYLILGTIGASLYLLGVAYLYAATGTLNMADLAQRLPELVQSKAVLTGLNIMFIGLAVKMALVPLHGWLPDAYSHAPDAVSPLLASMATKVVLYAVVRLIFWVLGAGAVLDQIPLMTLLNFTGILTTVVGAFLALTQRDLKRMFAYGGISHVGLILMGMTMGNETGFAGGLFYLVNDAVMQATLFILAGTAIVYYQADDLDHLLRLRGRTPWILATLIIMAMSMVGIPPTGGFFGKWYIVLGAIEAGNWLAVAAVIGATLLTLGYFLRIMEKLFFVESGTAAPPTPVGGLEAPPAVRWSLGVLSASTLVLGLFSDRIITLILLSAIPKGM